MTWVEEALVEGFTEDRDADFVEFHQWYCDGPEECTCNAYRVTLWDTLRKGAHEIGESLEPLLPDPPEEVLE